MSGRRGDLRSGKAECSGGGFDIRDTVPVREALTTAYSQTEKGGPIAVLDTDSFRRRFLNPDVVKEIRIKGRELWLITYIECVDDVIDCMCGSYDMICIPTHTADDNAFLESTEVSDCIIPVVFVINDDMTVSGTPLDSETERIRGLGLFEYLVLDVRDMTLDHRMTDDSSRSAISAAPERMSASPESVHFTKE
ncbi:MAG: hypothetical protein ACI4Q9_05540 [Candidatus Methanomethylophilaceae archaeon]